MIAVNVIIVQMKSTKKTNKNIDLLKVFLHKKDQKASLSVKPTKGNDNLNTKYILYCK